MMSNTLHIMMKITNDLPDAHLDIDVAVLSDLLDLSRRCAAAVLSPQPRSLEEHLAKRLSSSAEFLYDVVSSRNDSGRTNVGSQDP